jgi:CheY-like chemotaxis protein/predicted RNA-binding Zn-ribbon protein involved in translation (DUF1610 family)
MNCPRCQTSIGPLASPDAIVTCPGCGSRLMTRSAAMRSQGASIQAAAANPSAPSSPPAQPQPTSSAPAGVKVGVTTVSGKATGAALKPGGHKGAAILEKLLAAIQAVQETQQLILEELHSLRRSPAARGGGAVARDATDDDGAVALSPIRASRRKSVVLVDDDPQTRQAALSELQGAEIPVRAFGDGNTALSAIAEEKPDVVVLELGVGGDMGGKDLVNMIKATMEWVDIPIVLWTREAVSSQKEARQIHGADEVVPKSGGAAALVARVIQVFRR